MCNSIWAWRHIFRSSGRQIGCSLPGLGSVVDLEENLKHYIVLGSRAGSLRVEIVQCSSIEVWLKEVVRSSRFSGK